MKDTGKYKLAAWCSAGKKVGGIVPQTIKYSYLLDNTETLLQTHLPTHSCATHTHLLMEHPCAHSLPPEMQAVSRWSVPTSGVSIHPQGWYRQQRTRALQKTCGSVPSCEHTQGKMLSSPSSVTRHWIPPITLRGTHPCRAPPEESSCVPSLPRLDGPERETRNKSFVCSRRPSIRVGQDGGATKNVNKCCTIICSSLQAPGHGAEQACSLGNAETW